MKIRVTIHNSFPGERWAPNYIGELEFDTLQAAESYVEAYNRDNTPPDGKLNKEYCEARIVGVTTQYSFVGMSTPLIRALLGECFPAE